MIVVKFWNKGVWHTFEEYGFEYEATALEIAKKLAALFSNVEMHFYGMARKNKSAPVEIETVYA